MSAMTDPKLPELPPCVAEATVGPAIAYGLGSQGDLCQNLRLHFGQLSPGTTLYTAAQMHAYARAAVEQAGGGRDGERLEELAGLVAKAKAAHRASDWKFHSSHRRAKNWPDNGPPSLDVDPDAAVETETVTSYRMSIAYNESNGDTPPTLALVDAETLDAMTAYLDAAMTGGEHG